MKQRNSKIYWLVFIGVVLVATVIVFCVWLPYKDKTKAPDSNQNLNTNQEQNTNANINNNSETSSFDQKDNQNQNINANTNVNDNVNQNLNSSTETNNAESYYNLGIKYNNEKNYDLAISNYSKAIDINPKVSDYYSKKAESQISTGNKNGAIATIEAGLVALPGNELLQNKLDIIKATVK